MPDYTVSEIPFSDTRGNQQMDALLHREGIRRDRNLDYSCGIFDENINLIATGSFFKTLCAVWLSAACIREKD